MVEIYNQIMFVKSSRFPFVYYTMLLYGQYTYGYSEKYNNTVCIFHVGTCRLLTSTPDKPHT